MPAKRRRSLNQCFFTAEATMPPALSSKQLTPQDFQPEAPTLGNS